MGDILVYYTRLNLFSLKKRKVLKSLALNHHKQEKRDIAT